MHTSSRYSYLMAIGPSRYLFGFDRRRRLSCPVGRADARSRCSTACEGLSADPTFRTRAAWELERLAPPGYGLADPPKNFPKKIRTPRNPLLSPDDYVIERAELEFVPHHVPARLFFVRGSFPQAKRVFPTDGPAEQLPLVGLPVEQRRETWLHNHGPAADRKSQIL